MIYSDPKLIDTLPNPNAQTLERIRLAIAGKVWSTYVNDETAMQIFNELNNSVLKKLCKEVYDELPKCPVCGKKTIIITGSNGEVVCRQCGVVLQESFVEGTESKPFREGPRERSRYLKFLYEMKEHERKRVSPQVTKGIQVKAHEHGVPGVITSNIPVAKKVRQSALPTVTSIELIKETRDLRKFNVLHHEQFKFTIDNAKNFIKDYLMHVLKFIDENIVNNDPGFDKAVTEFVNWWFDKACETTISTIRWSQVLKSIGVKSEGEIVKQIRDRIEKAFEIVNLLIHGLVEKPRKGALLNKDILPIKFLIDIAGRHFTNAIELVKQYLILNLLMNYLPRNRPGVYEVVKLYENSLICKAFTLSLAAYQQIFNTHKVEECTHAQLMFFRCLVDHVNTYNIVALARSNKGQKFQLSTLFTPGTLHQLIQCFEKGELELNKDKLIGLMMLVGFVTDSRLNKALIYMILYPRVKNDERLTRLIEKTLRIDV